MDELTDLTKKGCDACPFRGKKIGPKGDPRAKVVVVGESPGVEELRAGQPFMGPSGQILDSNLPPDLNVFVTNALCCMPVKKDPRILAKAVQCCRERLLDEIRAHPRDVIIALGNGAMWGLTGDYSLKITQERGKRFPSNLAKEGIVVTVHPAYLLRGGGSYKKFQEDIRYALDIAAGKQTRTYIDPEIVTVTPEMVIKVKNEIREKKVVACDIETTGLHRKKHDILTIGFCVDPKTTYIAPATLLHSFKDVMEDKNITWIWHNGKFDIGFIRTEGVHARVDEDSMLLNYALDETRGIHDLDQVATDVLAAPSHKHVIDDWFSARGVKKENRNYGMLPTDILYPYQGKDLSKTLQIWRILREQVRADIVLEKLYTKTLLPASEMLCHVEATGFAFDWEKWQEQKNRLEKELDALGKEMNALAGRSINPASSQQMCVVLYDELRLRTKKRSTDQKVVALLPKHPVVLCLQKWRKANKALSTYVVGMVKNVCDDNRVYPTFLIHGTRTGRLSCRNPNLQNIPRDARLKGLFRAAPGYILIDFDASQAELRSLAIQSGDPALIAIYTSTDRSLHKETALYRYGLDYDEEDYIRAKAVNFGVMYGRTAHTIAEEFRISVTQAQKEIDAFWLQFPVAAAYTAKCRSAALKRQTLVTAFGRKCRPGMVSRENMNEVQNEFANFPHQSTASDITLHVAMRVRERLAQLGARIVDLVHDSIVVECPNDPAKISVARKIVENEFPKVATDWGLTKVPFIASSKLCINWGNTIEEK